MADTVVAALNAGGGAYTDADGTTYQADGFIKGSRTFSTTASIDGTVDDALYQSERWSAGGLSYDVAVGPGDYLVTLRFAEIYFDQPGERIFDATVEGQLPAALDDVDLVALVGPRAAYDVTVPVTVGGDGNLDIDLTASVQNAKINAIEITAVDATPDAPTDLDVTPKSFAEEAAFSAALTATDPDSSDLTFSLTDDPSGLFEVQGSQLVLTAPVDYEALPAGFEPGGTIDLGLRVEDEGGRSHEETVTLTVEDVDEDAPVPISFDVDTLTGEPAQIPTSLQFGPDGRLYVSELDGRIHILTVAPTGAGGYEVTETETITEVAGIANHDDDGALNAGVTGRQVTGLVVTGTAADPVIYVGSSDPRWGGGAEGGDTDLDTNSGIISRLTKTGGGWEKTDIVRGLPRSEENHSTNGLEHDAATNTLYVAQGGHTNAGAPSQKFAYLNEYALSGAVLSIDLDAIGDTTYDIPTVDDPTRAGEGLWGGNDGLNQARLVDGGPVQVHSPGYRNIYDLALTEDGRLYTIDNGPNPTWGGVPDNEGGGSATNRYDPTEPGSGTVNNKDGLHLVGPGYYGGHPNPLRANPDGAGLYTDDDAGTAVWREQGGPKATDLPASWRPVDPSLANPVEGDYRQPGAQDGALYAWSGGLSVNGLDEYTAGAFGGKMEGDLVAAALDSDEVFRVDLDNAGTQVKGVTTLAKNFANRPIDVEAQGDADPFPGTMWVASMDGTISVFTPSGGGGTAGDADGDGYSDADEAANGTDPNNAASTPADLDGDFTSDLNDADDDNDGIDDPDDHFARDAANGTNLQITASDALLYPMFSTDPGTGMFGLGFTGLMSNGTTDYLDQYVKDNLIAGGATGTFTVIESTKGDAILGRDKQDNGFQFGIDIAGDVGAATVTARVLNPFQSGAPEPWQSTGIQIGPGHQDAYVKIVLGNGSTAGSTGIQVLYEEDGRIEAAMRYDAADVAEADSVDFFLTVDPDTGVVVPSWQYLVDGGQMRSGTGDAIATQGDTRAAIQGTYQNGGLDGGLAVGVLSTHLGSSGPIEASYDSIAIYAAPAGAGMAAPLALAGFEGGPEIARPILPPDLGPIEVPPVVKGPKVEKLRGDEKSPYDEIDFDVVTDRTEKGALRDKPGVIVVPGEGGLRLDATDTLVLNPGRDGVLPPGILKKIGRGVDGVFEGALGVPGRGADRFDDDAFVFGRSGADPVVGDPPEKPGVGFGAPFRPVPPGLDRAPGLDFAPGLGVDFGPVSPVSVPPAEWLVEG